MWCSTLVLVAKMQIFVSFSFLGMASRDQAHNEEMLKSLIFSVNKRDINFRVDNKFKKLYLAKFHYRLWICKLLLVIAMISDIWCQLYINVSNQQHIYVFVIFKADWLLLVLKICHSLKNIQERPIICWHQSSRFERAGFYKIQQSLQYQPKLNVSNLSYKFVTLLISDEHASLLIILGFQSFSSILSYSIIFLYSILCRVSATPSSKIKINILQNTPFCLW